MTTGIEKTLQVLSKSKNKAALALMEAALASSDEAVRIKAGREIVTGQGLKGILELVRRFESTDDHIIALFERHRDRTLQALRTAIIGSDPQLIRNAYRIILSQQYFEMIPTLLSIALDQGSDLPDGSPLPDVVLQLVDQYAKALESRRQRRFLHGTLLPEVFNVIVRGLKEYHRNDPDLILRVFLYLFVYLTEENQDIAKILRNPSMPAYLTIYRMLLSGEETPIFQFIFHCLNNSDPPPVALSVFAKRFDIPFFEFILKQVKQNISKELKDNLAKVQHFEWLDKQRTILDQLDGESQAGFVSLLKNVRIPVEEHQSMLIDILRHGKPEGRRAALAALTEYSGERIDQIVWQAADDSDPGVQAAALLLLKKRDIPKAITRIIQFADSPHELVRETVYELLPELRFKRFMETFDGMSDDQRRMMFQLVKKMDPKTSEEISELLSNGEPIQKAKALLCIEYGNLVSTLEESLCSLLSVKEPVPIRIKAAELLASGKRELSRSSLVQVFHRDPSPEVRAAAKKSLETRPVQWNK